MTSDFDQCGYAIIEDAVGPSTVPRLIDRIGAISANQPSHAIRNLLAIMPEVRDLARSGEIRRIIEPILGPSVRAVRGILFDKTPDANWKVAWHQDLSIAVDKRVDLPGFGPWSMKAGVQHVQPPVEILRQMVTVRLHLDDCDADNGPLRVLPGSHRGGVLSDEAIRHWHTTAEPAECHVKAGGVVLMRPLILHASSTASVVRHRRVVHLEFAGCELPEGLRWFESGVSTF